MTEMLSVHNPFQGGEEGLNYFYSKEEARAWLRDDNIFVPLAISKIKGGSLIPYTVNGCRYEIFIDPKDAEGGMKKMGVHEAVRIVTARGFRLPAHTRFYISSDWAVQNRAFHFDNLGNPACNITVGPGALRGGSGIGISAQDTPEYAKAAKICIHEIGHSLHAHNVGFIRFYTDPRLKLPSGAVGAQVSQYAGNNNIKELIAEAFLGMMIGREYGHEIIRAYTMNGGPRIMQGGGRTGFGIMK